MSHYPVVIIPPRIQRVKSVLPPVKRFNELRPRLTEKEPKKVNKTVIAVEAGVVTMSSIVVENQLGTVPGILLFLAGAGAVITQAWRKIQTYRIRKKKYRKQVAVFKRNLANYGRKKTLHEQRQKANHSPEGIATFQYKLLLNVLKRTVSYDGDGSNAGIGATEAKFMTYLEKYFPNKIYTQLKVQNPAYDEGFHYTPDFAYIDKELNLHIDIEIDEPYVFNSFHPIHFIGKDDVRNNEFRRRGWIVIRFSEEQIICSPLSCCKTIALTISQITKDKLILSGFRDISDLRQQSQWTDLEAIEMAINKARNKYVCLKR